VVRARGNADGSPADGTRDLMWGRSSATPSPKEAPPDATRSVRSRETRLPEVGRGFHRFHGASWLRGVARSALRSPKPWVVGSSVLATASNQRRLEFASDAPTCFRTHLGLTGCNSACPEVVCRRPAHPSLWITRITRGPVTCGRGPASAHLPSPSRPKTRQFSHTTAHPERPRCTDLAAPRLSRSAVPAPGRSRSGRSAPPRRSRPGPASPRHRQARRPPRRAG
jgi:hypothetical protein